MIKELTFIGKDDWDRPTYKDKTGKLWKNVDLRYGDSNSLYSVSGNEIDGEPLSLMEEGSMVTFKGEPSTEETERRMDYMILGRLKSDCDYFLGNGNHYPGCLYYKDVDKHIQEMKNLWNSFSEDLKPEWISMEQIENLEKEMKKENIENEEDFISASLSINVKNYDLS